MFWDSHWSNLRSALIGAAIAAVVTAAIPAVAAVGSNLILGQGNNADAITSLSGAATANLRITNTQAASPALDLRVVSGAAPLKVNSTVRVANLNADRLDGKHASAFALLGHTHTGVYLPVSGMAANSALLGGLSSAAFSPAGHNHDASYVSVVGSPTAGNFPVLTAGGELADSASGPASFAPVAHDHSGVYLPVAGKAADADLLDGADSAAFSRRAMACPPGTSLLGYGRSGPLCSGAMGSAVVDGGGDVGAGASLVLDASGLPVVSYYDATNGDLRLVRCGNATCSSGNVFPYLDGAAADVGWFTSLVLDGSDRPMVAYYDATNQDLKVVFCGDRTCSSGNTIRTLDSAGDVGWYPSLTLAGSGYPVIAYYDRTNFDLKLAACGDFTCSSGNLVTTVDSGGNVGGFPSLVLNGSGYPVISYYDYANSDLKLAVCGNGVCSADNTITTVDSTGMVGLDASLALDVFGRPVVSYFDASNQDLKAVFCGDPTCSSGNTFRTLDTAGWVGEGTSLVLDGSGRPVISYFDYTNGDLKLVACGDRSCQSGNTIRTLDSAGEVGYYASLALDGSGHAIVGYYDYTNGDLKLAAYVGQLN